MASWQTTRHVGVRYRESDSRKHRGKPDRYYSIRYKSHKQTVEEAVGWQSDGITPQYCSQLRGKIVSNIKVGRGFQSLHEKREREEAKRKAEKSKAITLGQAFEAFKATRNLKETTLREYERSMKTAFHDWKDRKVVDISRDAVSKRHQKLKDQAQKNFMARCRDKGCTPTKKEKEGRGGAQANLHMRFLRSLLNFCAGYYEDVKGEPLLKHNPVRRLSDTKQWAKVQRRQTIIKPDQMPAWFNAVLELKNENIRDFLIFLFLTGSRKEEALSIPIDQIDLKNRTCTFLDTKNGEDITLPLPDYLLNILQARIQKLGGHKYLFPGMNRDGSLNLKTHLREPKAQVQKVIENSGVKFTLHDLRRRYITTADELDLSGFAIKRLVNHSLGHSDVTSGYVVSDVERLRKPAQQIEDRLLSLANARESGKVIPLQIAKN